MSRDEVNTTPWAHACVSKAIDSLCRRRRRLLALTFTAFKTYIRLQRNVPVNECVCVCVIIEMFVSIKQLPSNFVGGTIVKRPHLSIGRSGHGTESHRPNQSDRHLNPITFTPSEYQSNRVWLASGNKQLPHRSQLKEHNFNHNICMLLRTH